MTGDEDQTRCASRCRTAATATQGVVVQVLAQAVAG